MPKSLPPAWTVRLCLCTARPQCGPEVFAEPPVQEQRWGCVSQQECRGGGRDAGQPLFPETTPAPLLSGFLDFLPCGHPPPPSPEHRSPRTVLEMVPFSSVRSPLQRVTEESCQPVLGSSGAVFWSLQQALSRLTPICFGELSREKGCRR